MIRNLLYNAWPALHTKEWKLNLGRLARHAAAFNGKKIVLLKRGGPSNVATAGPEAVRAALSALGSVEIIEYENDPELGEVVGFVEALEQRLLSYDSNEATFYAHTKGVSYAEETELRHLAAIRRWRNTMYDECLGNIPRVESALMDHVATGCYLRNPAAVKFGGKGQLPRGLDSIGWHFAGTFFWFKHSSFFGHPKWRDVGQHRFGVEGHLGTLFRMRDAYCLYGEKEQDNLYTLVGRFRCTGCGHEHDKRMKMREEPVKVCPRCFKRKAEWVMFPDAPEE